MTLCAGTGVIDTLAIDDDLNPVIIEYKRPGAFDRDALIQLMNYYGWFASDENHINYMGFIKHTVNVIFRDGFIPGRMYARETPAIQEIKRVLAISKEH